jgi:hypothetical protein
VKENSVDALRDVSVLAHPASRPMIARKTIANITPEMKINKPFSISFLLFTLTTLS